MAFFHELRARWEALGGLDRPALEGDGQVEDLPRPIPYAELDQRVRRAAAWLHRAGLQPGEILALQLPRGPLFVELFLGAQALGAAVLPLNPRAAPAELDAILADTRPRLALLSAAGLRASLDATPPLPMDALPPPADEALACLLATSGTTGRPKAAMISQGNLRATVATLHAAWRWGPQDHLLHALPLFHVHGLFVALLGALWAGARCTLVERFEAQACLDLLAARRCTVFMGVPTFYHRMLSLPEGGPDLRDPDLLGMRLFTCGSAALPAADLEAFRQRFGHTILERYGMTEVGIVLSNPYEGERRPGSVGRPLPGVEVRIVDPEGGRVLGPGHTGELQIRGPSVMLGYLHQPEQTQACMVDGWMRSGDLACADPDGYHRIVGRIKDLVISGGFNVIPAEVERVLSEFPGLAELAVLGRPDPDLGERVVAAVVPRPGQVLDLDALDAFARARLAAYKCPRQWLLREELPRNAMGKVDKARLRAAWEEEESCRS